MEKKIVTARPKQRIVHAPAKIKTIEYEQDFSKWAYTQARLLKKQEFSKLDIENLVEEIEDLSKRERDKLISYLENLLMHKLKIEFQSRKHTSSWDASIKEAQFRIHKVLERNPSLKPKLKNILPEAYYTARLQAVRETGLTEETFPEECPWTKQELFSFLDKKYL